MTPMPFHFSLSALLRLRESQEKNELQRLQTLVAQLAQIHAEIDSIDLQIEASRRELVEQASAGISGAELHAAVLGEINQLELRSRLDRKRDELERARKDQRTRYNEARMRREILSNLRERQLSAYQHEQARREQQLIDHLFLIDRSSRKRSDLSPRAEAAHPGAANGTRD